jgi:hypothetical protein
MYFNVIPFISARFDELELPNWGRYQSDRQQLALAIRG